MADTFFSNHIGNERIHDRMMLLAETKTIGHAYVFSGPEKIGKRTLAERIAMHLVEDVSRIVRLAPNRDEMEKKKDRSIDVSMIREARRRLSLGSETVFSVCIIDDAHRMSDAAQNALLKILEEPKGRVVFFLNTYAPSGLLPTVRSRCENVRFDLVDEEELYAAIVEGDEERWRLLARLSFGRPGILDRLLRDSEEVNRREILLRFFETFPRRPVFERLQLAQRIVAKPPSVRGILEDWAEFERHKARLSGDFVSSYRRIEKILQTSELFERTNANSRLLLETLLVSL
jgi:hypothetical protein